MSDAAEEECETCGQEPCVCAAAEGLGVLLGIASFHGAQRAADPDLPEFPEADDPEVELPDVSGIRNPDSGIG